MPLYDAWGRPVRTADLKRGGQSAPTVTGARQVWGEDVAGGLTPQGLAALLREAETPGPGAAEAYVDLAEQVEERYLHYLGVLSTRKRAVAQIPIRVEPASDDAEDVRDAELGQEILDRDTIEAEIIDVLDAVGKGYSVCEIDWETSERDWRPRRLCYRLPRWFSYDRETGTRLQVRDGGGWSDLRPWSHVVHETAAKSGLPIRGGLARMAAWAWLLAGYTTRGWARFVEAYGHPMRLGRYPPGATEKERDVLLHAVRNIAGDAAATIPEGMTIEFIEDRTVQGRSEVYREFLRYVDDRISIIVLGQTLTTEPGESGSYSMAQVHDRVRHDIERADARALAATLRRDLVIPTIALNHGPRDRYPRVVIEREPSTDLALLSQALERLVPLGLRVRADEVRTRMRLSEPGEDDEVLTAPAAPEPDPDGEPVPAAALAAEAGGRAALARVVEAIDADEWRSLAAPLVEPILARAADDPDGLLADLGSVYPALDADALTERLARILFVADFWARLEDQ